MLAFVSLIFIGAITGGMTNYIAIRMLFRPLQKRSLLGMRLPFTPGLIPKRIDDIVKTLGETVENYFINSMDMVEMVKNSGYREEIALYISRLLNEKLGPLLGDEMIYPLKVVISRKVIALAEEFVSNHANRLFERVSISDVVIEKLSKLDLVEIERMIIDVAGRELRYITLLGFILGGAIGLMNGLIVL